MRVKIRLESTAGTGCAYTTTKHSQNKEKMKTKKYDWRIRKHVEFVEKKIKG